MKPHGLTPEESLRWDERMAICVLCCAENKLTPKEREIAERYAMEDVERYRRELREWETRQKEML